jgi:hypothetical protein
MKLLAQPRRGNVAVIVGVCLPVLVGFAALALDGGLIQHNRRIAQAAADAAALAAANDLFINYPTNTGVDVGRAAALKAEGAALANGFNNDLTNNKVTVNIPPTTGMHAGQPGYAEVLIEYFQQRNFSAIFGSDKVTVRARSVAMGQWVPFRNGILVLNPSLPSALNNNGSGLMKVVNADVIVNSNAADGAAATGGGVLEAPTFYLTGDPGYTTSGSGTFRGNLVNKQAPTPDPLAYLDPPDWTTMTVQSSNPTNYSGNRTVTLSPGVYYGGIHVSGQVSVTMQPGIYYMKNGGFSFTGQGSLSASGVMIYTEPNSNSDVVNVNGLGTISWSPPTTGIYKGIALWQERSSDNTVYLTGNGTSRITGTFYARGGMLTVSGNGTQDVLGSQYISDRVNLGGNGNFNIDWLADQTARTRSFTLVE